MPIVSRLSSIWRHLTNRGVADIELTDELRAYVDLLAEEKMRLGAPAESARRDALMEVGIAQVYDTAQQSRSGASIERLVQDIRYASRTLRRSPGFAFAAIVVLALGIGASTTVLSVVQGVLLRPFDYVKPDQLVVVLNNGRNPVAAANYLDFKNQNHSFSTLGAAEFWTPSLIAGDRAEKIFALHQTADILPMLGVPAELGRIWSADNDVEGNEHVAVISHRMWQQRFGGDSSVIGRRVLLDGESYAIVAVMPPSFAFAPFWATRAELWAPLPLAKRAAERGGNSLRVFGRLAPNVSATQAQKDIAAIAARIEREFPGSNSDVQVVPLAERVFGDVRTPLLLMLGAVAFVLLMSCTNVAHMMLARAAVRQREMAVRSALGANRGRLVRQVLTESMLLAGIGGAVGVALTVIGVRIVATFGAATIPRVQSVSLNPLALMCATFVTLVCGVGFGLAPALRSSSDNISGTLREGGRGLTGASWHRARRLLIGSQFALAVVLLIGAGLMIRSVAALRAINPGFNSRGVVSAIVTVAGTSESAPGRRENFYREVVQQINALPSVASASGINHAPLSGDVWGFSFRIEGRPVPINRADAPNAVYRVVLPRYFSTMGIRMLHGRDVSDADRLSAPGVVVVNERLASLHWPGESAIGRRVSFGNLDGQPQWLTIVGVSANTVRDSWTAPAEAEVFLPLLQNRSYLEDPASHFAALTLIVRAKCAVNVPCDANAIVPAMRQVIASADATVPLSDITTMDDAIANATAEPRFYLTLLTAFSVIALILASVGIYGVMSYAVAQRTREMGVRLALGASPRTVLMHVLREGLLLAMSGTVIGVAAALLLSRFMSAMLYGVKATDPLTFAMVLGVLLLAALIAVLVPARRATSIDPLLALRAD